MKKIAAVAAMAVVLVGFIAVPAYAQSEQTFSAWDVCPEGVEGSSNICADTTEAKGIVKNLVNLFLYAIGILSVIMIIHSGLKYVTSRGDAEMIKSAKNTLLYAVIGLIVAMLAFAIVNFVIGAFGGNAPVSDDNLQNNQQQGINE